MTWQPWWGVNQWAAYLEHMQLPVNGRSKLALRELEANFGDNLAPREYAKLLLQDPLLALRLLKEANSRIPRHVSRDITTPLGIVLTLGTEEFRRQLESAPEVADDNIGFIMCEGLAALAAEVSVAWGGLHFDLDPGELALAALLSNAGEIELWAFAPELPQKAQERLHEGLAKRSKDAQRDVCGFTFMDLTLKLNDDWNLPQLIRQLVRGDETHRAQLARLAVDTARHLGNGADDAALPDDVLTAAHLTQASLKTVIEAMPALNAEEKEVLLESALALQAARHVETAPE